MKKLFFLILLTLCFHISFGQILIGVVDMDKLIEQHPKKPYYDSIIQAYEKNANDSLINLEKEILRIAYDNEHSCSYYRVMLQKDPLFLDSMLVQKENQINFLTEKLEKLQALFISEHEVMKKKSNRDLKQTITDLVSKYGLQKGYFYIIDKQSIAFTSNDNDITDEILKLMITK